MRTSSTILAGIATALLAVAGSGCIGTYSNQTLFMPPPQTGMTEGDMIRTYGTPAYAGFAEDQKIYTYKVRDTKYIVLVGVYSGYDLVVTCENGVVTQVNRVMRPETFALFQPLPWAVTD